MIFSKPLILCTILASLCSYTVKSSAYEININGQTYQVSVIGQQGENYGDRTSFSDDYGQLLDTQKTAICSSLRGEYCPQVTNNGAQTHNLFNYFPTHTQESIVAHANDRYNKNQSPYLMKQPLDDRIIHSLSRQNPHFLGTKPTKPKTTGIPLTSNLNDIAQSLFDSMGDDPLQHVTTKRFRYKNKKKKTDKPATAENNDETNDHELTTTNSDDISNDNNNGAERDEYEDIEIELYSNLGDDAELANALGLDDEELGETVDRLVAQLISSYLDNDSDEVDVSQIFANEVGNDVSMEQLDIDEGSMQEMGELLNAIAKKHKKKQDDVEGVLVDGTNDGDVDGESEDGDAQIYALKFVVDSETNTNEEQGDDDDDDQVDDGEEVH